MKKIFPFLLVIVSLSFSQSQKKENDTLIVNLEQITVTATRYSENLLEIPYSVSVISKSEMNLSKGLGIDEILNKVPGVMAQSRAGNQDVRLVIRGFGARGAGDRSNYGTIRGIKILQDGIPETEPDGRTSLDLIDISLAHNIEVIRSNASALWGNASGGVINFSTIPIEDYSFYKFEFNADSFGMNKMLFSSFYNFDGNKLIASITNSKFNGWREHSSNYRSLINVAFSNSIDQKIRVGIYLAAASNVFKVPGPLTQKQFDENPIQANPFYVQRDERRHNRLGRLGVTFDYSIDENNSISSMTFVSPKYLQRSERGTFRDFNRYHIGGSFIFKNQKHFSEEFQNHFVAGFDEAYQDGAILFYNLSSTNGRGNQLKDNKREGANTFGAFIQEELVYNEKYSLILGLRLDDVTYYSENYLNPIYGLQEKSFKKITPKVGFTFRANPTLSFYANIGGGVEVPAGNETDPSSIYGDDKVYLINPLLEPITSTTYEAGIKQINYFGKESFIESLNYDLAFYYIKIKNDIVPYRGGRFYFTSAQTNRKGIELGFTARTNFNVDLSGSLTFSDNKYQNYLVDSIHYGVANKFTDYSGNKVAGIPSAFYNFSLRYSLKKIQGIFANLNLQSVSNYFIDDSNQIEVPSFQIINFAIGIDEGIEVGFAKIKTTFSINNLFDKKYAASAYINPDVVNKEAYFLEPGLPRNYNLSISIGL